MKLRLRLGIAGLLTMALAGVSAAQSAVPLPPGVKAVWDLSKAYNQRTPTRERICINGLWLWQPATGAEKAVPASGWGYFRVPGPWPGNDDWQLKNSQTVFANPAWKDTDLSGVTAAWYQREINIPAAWASRRIALDVDCLNSYAAVYLDGQKAGELRFPGGELDLTAQCRPGATHMLSMLVIAVPLHEVMFSHSDTFGSKQVQGNVVRRGLCGDVWLAGAPIGPRISGVKVDTSVRKWEITFEAGLDALAPDVQYTLKAVVSAKGLPDHEFTGKPFTAADLKGAGWFSFTSSWKPEKLWDTNTPQNMYNVSLSLLGPDSKTLDVAVPERFGFREFWINGRDFCLNGTRIFLFGVPFDNALLGAGMATYDAAKETMLRMKSFGVNFVYGHNYDCEPGSHISYAEVLRAADDAGMLVALPLPHFQDYDWTADNADQTNGYASHAEYYIRRVAMSHPSVIAYAMSHNATGYFGMKDPDLMDSLTDPRKDGWSINGAKLALRCQAIVEKFDASRVIYHHSSGNLGEMFTSNFYVNFAPIEELDDWFEHWAAKGVKPIFLCECGSPISWDFSMYRGWFGGGRGFGSSAVPWELCVAQWNSQFFGDAAFRISDQEKEDLRWESKRFLAGGGWHHWDYPVQFEDIEATKPTIAEYATDNFRAFRTWGLSAFDWWEYQSDWTLRNDVDKGRKDLKVDWDDLQRPGFSPDYVAGRYMAMPTAFERTDWTPDATGQALLRNNMPLLAYIAGKSESFISKDHNFVPGETIAKQVIIINNSRAPVMYDCSWSADLPTPQAGHESGTVETGRQERIPVGFTLPADLPPGKYRLSAAVKFGDGETQKDSFQLDILPPARTPALNLKIALFDPKGETARMLDAMKIPCQTVDANADLGGYDLLVVGKEALTVNGAAPNIMRVKDGLRVIVFEQTCDALTKRLGFRAEEYGLRRVFKRVPDSPLLAGLDTDNLRDWRGDATLIPPRITYPFKGAYQEDMVEWCGVRVHHIFRCGCLGNVASVLIEKPARGDFMPALDGGWSLEYSPLMVYREGKGMALFCQMDVTGRTESDPAAETLVGNIFRYVSSWKAAEPGRKAIYVGDPAGRRHLEHSGITPAAYEAGKLSPDDVLVVGKGGGKALAADAQAVAAFIKAGGRVLALGLGQDEARTLLPAAEMKDDEHISTFYQPFDGDSPFAGIGPADVYNAGCSHIPLVTGGVPQSGIVGDGVLAKLARPPYGGAPDANFPAGAGVLFFQLPPYSVTDAEGAVQSLTVDTAGEPPDGTHSLLVQMGTASELGVRIVPSLSVDPVARLKRQPWIHDTVNWTPQVGKTYTFAVMVKGEGGPITVRLEVERNGYPYDRILQGADTAVPAGKWTDLHATFKCDKPFPQGWNAYLSCGQEGGSFRVDLFRLYEGDYAPPSAQAGAAAPQNWIVNPGFEADTRDYWIAMSEQFNLRRTYRRTSFVMTRLLANLGVAGSTPLLSRFASPVADQLARPPSGGAEERWTDGLYVDQVEAWDDPYGCFNW